MNDKVKAPKRSEKTYKARRGIRELPSGRFQVRFTDPYGQVQTGGTFLAHEDAVARLDGILRAIETGRYEQKKAIEEGGLNPKTLTLSELAEHWRSIRVSKRGEPLSPSYLKECQRLIDSTLKELKDRPIKSISAMDIEKWWAPQFRRAPRQANSAYKHLKSLMDWAVRRKLLATNPCDIYGATSYTSKEPPVPTAQQVQIMLEVAPEEFKALFAFAAWGGLRRGEILALRRSDIEFVKDDSGKDILVHITKALTWEDRVPGVREPKANSVRTVVMPQLTNGIITKHLNSLPISPDALLFPRSPGSSESFKEYQLRPIWEKIRAQAGFSGRFHSLRGFGASEYSKTDANDVELMKRFGHKDIKTAMRYQRTTGRERDLARKLG